MQWINSCNSVAATVSGSATDMLIMISAVPSALAAGVQTAAFDLNTDDQVNTEDLTYLVTTHLGTTAGDANLDQRVDRADIVTLLSNFGRSSQAVWTNGNFDDDARTTLADLALLQSNFGFVGSPEPASLSVEAADTSADSPIVDPRAAHQQRRPTLAPRTLAASPRRLSRAVDQIHAEPSSLASSATEVRANRLRRAHRSYDRIQIAATNVDQAFDLDGKAFGE